MHSRFVVALTAFALGGCADRDRGVDVGRVGVVAQGIADGAVSTRESVVTLTGPAPCSAVAIAPRVVLSARHCAADPATGEVLDLPFVVGIGDDRSAPEVTVPVREVRVAAVAPFEPDGTAFLSDMNGEDLAVALLDEDLPVTPTPIVRAAPAGLIGSDVTLVGYGLTGDAAVPPGTKREVTATVDDVSGALIAFRPSALCAGDSGGPAFDVDGNVLGVHSFGAGNDAACGTNLGVVNGVWNALPFLDDALACPQGGCAPAGDGKDGDAAADAGCGGDATAAVALPALLLLRRRRRTPGLARAALAALCLGGSFGCGAPGDDDNDGNEDDDEPPAPVALRAFGLRACPDGAEDVVIGNSDVAGFAVFGRVDVPAGTTVTHLRTHTIWGPAAQCRCDLPHTVQLIRATQSPPEASPEVIFSQALDGSPCEFIGEHLVELDEPFVVGAGDQLYVVDDLAGVPTELSCVAGCVGDDLESGWGSAAGAPFAFVELTDANATPLAPRFELLGPG